MPLKGADMLVPRRVIIFDQIHTQPSNHIDSSIWCITLVVAPFVWSGFFASPQKKRLPFYPSKKKNKKLQNTNKVGTLQRIHQIQKKQSHFWSHEFPWNSSHFQWGSTGNLGRDIPPKTNFQFASVSGRWPKGNNETQPWIFQDLTMTKTTYFCFIRQPHWFFKVVQSSPGKKIQGKILKPYGSKYLSNKIFYPRNCTLSAFLAADP